MKLFHGSPIKFDSFDFRYIGQTNGTNEGKGFYFSDKSSIAKGYTGNDGYLYTVELDVKGTINEQEKKFSKAQYRQFLIELQKKTDFLSNYGEVDYEGFEKVLNRALNSEYDNSDNDVDIICSIANGSGNIEAVHRTLYELFNVNCIVCENAKWGQQRAEKHIVYVALLPEMISIINIQTVQPSKNYKVSNYPNVLSVNESTFSYC